MRSVVLLGLILGAVSLAAHGEDLWLGPTMLAKPLPGGEPAPLVPRTQGDTVEDPFLVTGIPFSAAGNTCGFNNDYDAVCFFSGSTAPDVVYRHDCPADIAVDIDLCGSTYDTKVYVFEDAVGNVIACNDDYCSWQSHLTNVPFATGHTYFIVVDGYGTSCGDYALVVSEHVPCTLECPTGAMPEGEPDCYEGYSDSYNSGCGCHPFPVYTMIEPSCDPIVICGTSGVFLFGSLLYRDTDWYEIDLTEPAQICLSGDAEIPMYYFIIDGRSGCEGMEYVAYANAGPCSPMTDLCYYCGAGTWWPWAGPNAWDPSFECGSIYRMQIDGYSNGTSPADQTTWGRVKGLFR